MRKTHAAFVALFCALGVTACVEPPPTATTTTTTTSTTTTTTVPVQELDQDFDPGTFTYYSGVAACGPSYLPDVRTAQTFTSGKTGSLDKVALAATQPVVNGYSAPAPLDVSIQTVNPDGSPSGTEIGGTLYTAGPPGSSTVLAEIPLDDPAPVVQGEQYAIVLAESECLSPPSYYGWEFSTYYSATTDGYVGGEQWRSGSGGWTTLQTYRDLLFRTWVT